MKKPFICILFLLFSVSVVTAQDKAQKEILELYYKYQDAAIKSDYVFMENVLAQDFISIGPDADMKNREQSVTDMKEFLRNPRIRMLSLDHSDVKVRLSGDMAVVTADWTLKLVPVANENSEPLTETGRITLVFEKRFNTWLVTVEHVSFRPRKIIKQASPNLPK